MLFGFLSLVYLLYIPWSSWVGLLVESANQLIRSAPVFWDPCGGCYECLPLLSADSSSLPLFSYADQLWSDWGETKLGLLGNVSKGWGSRVLFPLSLSHVGESQAGRLSLGTELCCLWGGMTWVKWTCFSYPLQSIYSRTFLLKWGTWMSSLDFWFPTEVFPSMNSCQNWCFHGEYEG